MSCIIPRQSFVKQYICIQMWLFFAMAKIGGSLNVGLFLPEARLNLSHTQNKQPTIVWT